jgi:hypothetical protein
MEFNVPRMWVQSVSDLRNGITDANSNRWCLCAREWDSMPECPLAARPQRIEMVCDFKVTGIRALRNGILFQTASARAL